MTPVTDVQVVADEAAEVDLGLLGSLAVAVVVGAVLVATALTSALSLLIAVAAGQALFALAWVFGTGMPGRIGGLVIAALAAGGADTAASVWPHGRLGTLLAVLGLAVPVMFVHQLMRGAARLQIVSSLSAVALLVLAEVSLPAFLQLRHEFATSDLGGRVTATAVAAIAAPLAIGYFVDLLLPALRFDPAVPRGLLAVVGSAGMGAAVGYLLLHDRAEFVDGRSTFLGAALGVLTGLLAVAAAFILHTTPVPAAATARRLRPAIGALVPLFVLAPAAFLLCLAIRS
jgi:hypothetical protein